MSSEQYMVRSNQDYALLAYNDELLVFEVTWYSEERMATVINGSDRAKNALKICERSTTAPCRLVRVYNDYERAMKGVM